MSQLKLPLLLLFLGSLLGVPAPAPTKSKLTYASARPATQDGLEEASARLREAAASGTAEDRRRALEALVALPKGDVAAVLVFEYAQASEAVRGLRDEQVEKAYVLERRREHLAAVEARVKSGASTEAERKALAKEVRELSEKLKSLEGKHRRKAAWMGELSEATQAYFQGLAAGAHKKAMKGLWKDAQEHADLAVRLGAIEVLGTVAGAEGMEDLVALFTKAEGERTKLKKELVKLEREVREFEVRLQQDAEENDGRTSRSLQQQYTRVRTGASEKRRRVLRLAFVVDAAAEAAGHCLSLTEGKELPRAVAYLMRARKKAKKGLRLKVLDVLVHAESDAVSEALATAYGEEKDPLLRAEILDGLAVRGRSEDFGLFTAALADENWHVRSRGAAALAASRIKDAIPVLIARLEPEEGRTRSDVIAALVSLTGKNFRSRAELWRKWWDDEGDAFQVPEVADEIEGSLDAEERVGVTFFGIRTESQRVLFVLDLSGSMNFPMIQRSRSGRRAAEKGEVSRLDVAKQELVKALGGLRDGATFNLLFFANSVWAREDKPDTMEPDLRSEVLSEIQSLRAVGGTNVYGALQQAFDQAGVSREGEWNDPLFDTIYFLSDGTPSVGAIQSARDILEYVAERNRSAGIVIHTIGLSSEQDTFLLRSLAEQNGGTYVAR